MGYFVDISFIVDKTEIYVDIRPECVDIIRIHVDIHKKYVDIPPK